MRKLISRIFSRSKGTAKSAVTDGTQTDVPRGQASPSKRSASGSSSEPPASRARSGESSADSNSRSSKGGTSRKRKRGRRRRSGAGPRDNDDGTRDNTGRSSGESRNRQGGRGRGRERDARPGDDTPRQRPNPDRPARTHEVPPVVVKEADHGIDGRRVSRGARSIVEELRDAGYSAELVGGCVRDLLLGLSPKDFDIATDASPEDVQDLFRRSRLVGRRFRLAHVRMGREIYEVATYRSAPGESTSDRDHALTDDGRLISDNVYGTRQEDAERRDFTVNALYYDPISGDVYDYVDGYRDLAERKMRMIGDPETRLREDPVRMLRAIRFAAKLDLEIEAQCAKCIPELAGLLADVPPARLFDECLKLFHYGHALDTWNMLRDYDLAVELFPETVDMIDAGDTVTQKLLEQAFGNTDSRVHEGKPVIAPFLFAAALWMPMREREAAYLDKGRDPRQSFLDAAEETIFAQNDRIAIPRRVSAPTREIWNFQSRLERGRGKRTNRFLEHKRFRAAYDFLLLRAEAGDIDAEVAQWWTDYIDGSEDTRRDLSNNARDTQDEAGDRPKRKRRRRRRGGARNKRNSGPDNSE